MENTTLKQQVTKKAVVGFALCMAVAIVSALVAALFGRQRTGYFGVQAISQCIPPFANLDSLFEEDYIARIYITDVIAPESETYCQSWILQTIEDLTEDEHNKGIILYVDSPGGGVYEADETYLALMRYKDKTGSPVYAYFGPLAASGGYYISCAADSIWANRNTLTGSIGVIAGQFVDATELLDKIGVKSTTIQSGRNKLMGDLTEPMSPEQQQIMQTISDECYEQFTSIVAESRSLPIETVVSLADGRVYTASQARDNGLIDAIGSFEDALDAMTRREFDFEEYPVEDYYYQRRASLYDLLMGLSSHTSQRSASHPPLPFPAYYCPWQR